MTSPGFLNGRWLLTVIGVLVISCTQILRHTNVLRRECEVHDNGYYFLGSATYEVNRQHAHLEDMVMQSEQERIRHLLAQALPVLCRSGLSFSSEFSIEALIGITLDKNDVFLVSIKETIKSDTGSAENDQSLSINMSRVDHVGSERASLKRKLSHSSSYCSGNEDEIQDLDGELY